MVLINVANPIACVKIKVKLAEEEVLNEK